jgi:hypothetical protein
MIRTNQSSEPTDRPIVGLERLTSIGDAAKALGIRVWALRRAVKRGDVPSYEGFNSRRLVRLSEVNVAIEASKQGGSR